MSIFGTDEPKIIFSDSTTVNLDNAAILFNKPQYKTTIKESEFNGDRVIVSRPFQWKFICLVWLFKYTSPTPLAKYDTLDGFLFDSGAQVFPHRDESAIQNEDGDTLLFHFAEINRTNITTRNFDDALILTFITELGAAATAQPKKHLVDPEGRFIITPDGRRIRIR